MIWIYFYTYYYMNCNTSNLILQVMQSPKSTRYVFGLIFLSPHQLLKNPYSTQKYTKPTRTPCYISSFSPNNTSSIVSWYQENSAYSIHLSHTIIISFHYQPHYTPHDRSTNKTVTRHPYSLSLWTDIKRDQPFGSASLKQQMRFPYSHQAKSGLQAFFIKQTITRSWHKTLQRSKNFTSDCSTGRNTASIRCAIFAASSSS